MIAAIELKQNPQDYEIKCICCGKSPNVIDEYIFASQEENENPIDWVVKNEGTFNPINGHFYCTECYVVEGMPSGVAK